MNILLSWLQDFVEIPESAQEVAHALTMAGMAVDAIETEGEETVFEFDITSNRPDAMNHLGIAREVAAIYGRPLHFPSAPIDESQLSVSESATVEIEDSESCARYVGRVFADVRVGPSPDWLRQRLELCGVRSINNLADLTNYVLLEMGQPTHAFDLDTLGGQRIVVRRARAGEKLETLDGQERQLSPEHLAICDSDQPVALAGVMGGTATEITASTRNVLLEAAWFRPAVVRNASRHFKLFTEASHRFERGADWNGTIQAADRIASLLGRLEAGTVLGGRIDCFPAERPLPNIQLRRDRIARHLGVNVGDADVEAILKSLGFRPRRTQSGWIVPATSHRLDVEREVDLIEEVARIFGFERIPATLPVTGVAPAPTPHAAEEARLRTTVRSLGYDETIGFSFISSEEARRFGPTPGVKLRNPLSRLWDVMRNSMLPTTVRAVEWNLRRNQSLVRLAEFGRTYQQAASGHLEPRMLCLGASGTARPASWHEKSRPFGFYDMKADVEALLQPFETGPVRIHVSGVPACFRPGHAAAMRIGNRTLATFGELHPKIARSRKLRQPVLLAEIHLELLYKAGLRIPRHCRLPRVPSVTRDFSLIVPDSVSFLRIQEAVGEMPDLENLQPVEIFRGKKVPKGSHSLLLRASWQRLDESLTDEEVNTYSEELLAKLASKLRVKLRR